MKDKNSNFYLDGKKLYGDDFDSSEIESWFKDETEAYANLGAKQLENYEYNYHAFNRINGFSFLPNNLIFNNTLSFGGAWGNELIPIKNRLRNIKILEPSDNFYDTGLFENKVEYLKPQKTGEIPFTDNSFDLILCLSVLHHIPNVTKVMSEIYRISKSGGYVLIREPIVSMGDWGGKRNKGLTKRERGIPLKIFREIIKNLNFILLKENLGMFAPISKLGRLLGKSTYNNNFLVKSDRILSNLFYFNYRYHSNTFVGKFCPSAVFYVLRK